MARIPRQLARRGASADLATLELFNSYVGPYGEVLVDDEGDIRVHDGETPGGNSVLQFALDAAASKAPLKTARADVGDKAMKPGGFGGSFLSALAYLNIDIATPEAETSYGPRFVASITHEVVGGHVNGPGQTRGGLWIFAGKSNMYDSLEIGEVDALYLLVQTNRKDDAGGILIHAEKVWASAGNTGGLTPIEITSSRVNENAVITKSLQIIVGLQEGIGGFTNGDATGFYTEARVGTADSAISIVENGGNFSNLLRFGVSRDPASQQFALKWNGTSVRASYGSPTNHIENFYTTAASAMFWANTAGDLNLLVLEQTGRLTAANGVRVSSGSSTLTNILYSSAAIDIGNIPANSVVSFDRAITGVAVGDLITAGFSSDVASFGLVLTAFVPSPGLVRVFVQNYTATAIDPAAQTIMIKAERLLAA